MPSERQSQYAPVPNRLQGPRPRAQTGPTRSRSAPRRPVRDYGPTRLADKSTAGVGLLEAEYFGVLFLLLLQLFIGGSATYGDKIMSFMKRGMLVSILFFFLALMSGIGPNATKISKALGALVFVAIVLTTPGQDIITALDNFFKADWTGKTGSTASGSSSSADSGTQQTTQAPATASGAAGAASRALGDLGNLQNDLLKPGFFATNVGKTIGDGIISISDKLKSILGFL